MDEQQAKKPWESKTVWKGIIIALAALSPVANDFVAKNPQLILIALGGVDVILRLITKDKISLGE